MDKQQYEGYFTYNEPIPYKELLITPVTVKDYIDFFISVNCLMIEKNKVPDLKVIKMSYLDYLFYLINNSQEGQLYAQMLVAILNLCLGLSPEEIKYIKDEQGKIKLILKDVEYDKKDFDNIKNIILYQNIPEYDDTYIDPKVEKALQEAEEFVNRHKKKMGSLEDQIICVMLAMHETDEKKIHELTIRKFSKILQRYDYKLHYEIYKQAEMSGNVTFKQEIDHWMSEISKNKYSDVIIEYGQFKNKIENAKVN